MVARCGEKRGKGRPCCLLRKEDLHRPQLERMQARPSPSRVELEWAESAMDMYPLTELPAAKGGPRWRRPPFGDSVAVTYLQSAHIPDNAPDFGKLSSFTAFLATGKLMDKYKKSKLLN
jgi:hypothetical protein